MKRFIRRAAALATLAALAGSGPTFAETVRLHGAASVVDALIAPHKAVVEKATGDTIVIDKSNAGKGLIDLADGKCDAALASAEIATVVAAAKAAGREVDAGKLQMAVVATDEIVFVVNAANRVRALSTAQLRDIHAGRIANWKEVGGDDLPIQVVTDAVSSATRGLIKQVVLKDVDYTPSAKAVVIDEVSNEVARTPGAIGGLGIGFVKREGVAIVAADRIERPLGLVTVGAPSDKVRRVIEAYRAQVKR